MMGSAVVVENGCPATFRDCTFTGNEAPGYGGGVAVTGSTSQAKLIQCCFTGNDAPSGGGLSVQSGQATLVNNRFLGNQGGVGGGAFVVGGTTAFTNCVFSGNAVSGEMMALGGGLCVVGSGTGDVTNCTFSRNTASAEEDALGGGVYVESATATIKNTIAWGNLVNGLNTELGQIHKWSFSTFSLSFSCVQNWTSGGLGGAHNTASDPLLADPDGADNAVGTADDDVRLGSGSSAIDTASDAAVPDDDFDLNHDGDTSEPLPLDVGRGDRFLGTGPTVDMGAYEYLNTNGLGSPEQPPAGSAAPEPSGTAYIAFTYDALGRRIERTVDSGGASVEVTRYYYDAQNVVLETDADEAPRRSFVHGSQYVDERVFMRLPTGKEYYYLPRELYSVAALTDETGTIVEAATYDTYGQVAVYDGAAQAVGESPVGNPYYFTGRRLDLLPTASSPQPIAKQLYHYRAREYDPGNGRFLQRDPVGTTPTVEPFTVGRSGPTFSGATNAVRQYGNGGNLYQYVGSAPAKRLDPAGLEMYEDPLQWACCKYTDSAIFGSPTERFGLPEIWLTVGRRQRSVSCRRTGTPECCCKSNGIENRAGSTSRRTVTASWGRCCSCRVEQRRNNHTDDVRGNNLLDPIIQAGLEGLEQQHTAFFIKCSNGTRHFVDHAGAPNMPVTGHVGGWGTGSTSLWSEYPVFQRSWCVSCDTVSAVVAAAQALDGCLYTDNTDCQWFAREMASVLSAGTLSEDSCPTMP